MKANDLYTCAQVSEIDRRAISAGVPGIVLMKRAGRSAFNLIKARWPKRKTLIVLCGSGSNGGDGFIVAALAQSQGYKVKVYCTRSIEKLGGDARKAALYAYQEGVRILEMQALYVGKPTVYEGIGEGASGSVGASIGDSLGNGLDERAGDAVCNGKSCNNTANSVIVDALLGIGFVGVLRAEVAKAIMWANDQSASARLALDIPSGLNGDTGDVDSEVFKADMTMTFIAKKLGLIHGQGQAVCGDLKLEPLDIDPSHFDGIEPPCEQIVVGQNLPYLPLRELDAHKGQFGRVVVVGGDSGMGGAAIMASEAALTVGAGICSLYTREAHISAALARIPEVMCRAVDSSECLDDITFSASLLVLGPGLGTSEWSQFMATYSLKNATSGVLDADALNLLSLGLISLPDSSNYVLTPHPGEAARLLSCSIDEVQSNRLASAQVLASRYHSIVVLKGASSVIADGVRAKVCTAGNAAMAIGGMGDILSGIIAALMAQGLSAFDAATLGVWLHAKAADELVCNLGVHTIRPAKLLSVIPSLLATLMTRQQTSS
ncbi:MAG: hydroxyethylthiazole kinase-like uncharacterized protein yjeF [Flavobacteriales bacterium]|jgi:hydroxyethylthiazole kinase-like uncharacterized protein yjeF